MAITFTDGTITTSASEQNLFDITADADFSTYIFSNAMQSGDTVVIKVYVKDQNGSAMRVYGTATLSNVQADPAGYIPYLTTKQYKVTIQRTAGTDRAFAWQRIQR